MQHHARGVDHRQERRCGEALRLRVDGRAPARGRGGAAVGPRVLDRVPHGSHHQAARMRAEQCRHVRLGEEGVHRGQPAARVGHGTLALVVSRGAGFGTGTWTTPTPSAATPLRLIAPCTRTRYFPPGVSGCAVWIMIRS